MIKHRFFSKNGKFLWLIGILAVIAIVLFSKMPASQNTAPSIVREENGITIMCYAKETPEQHWQIVIEMEKDDIESFKDRLDDAIHFITAPDNLYSDYMKVFYPGTLNFYTEYFNSEQYESVQIGWYNKSILLENISESQANLSLSFVGLDF